MPAKTRAKRGGYFGLVPADRLAWVEKINSTKKAMRPKPNVRQAGLIELELPYTNVQPETGLSLLRQADQGSRRQVEAPERGAGTRLSQSL